MVLRERRGNKMEFNEIVEKMAVDLLEEYDNPMDTMITEEIVAEFVEEKKEYLQDYEELGDKYKKAVFEKIQKMQEEYEKNEAEIEQKPQITEKKQKKPEQKPKKVNKPQKRLWEFKCNAGLLKSIVKKTIPICNEIPISIKKNGLEIKVVDPAHVAMVVLTVPRRDFYIGNSCVNKEVEYNVKEDLEIGIDLEKLERTLKLFDRTDRITGYIENNKLNLVSEYDGRIRHKRISLLDTAGMPQSEIPKIEYSINAEVKGSELSTLKKAIDGEDYVTLIAKGDLKAVIDDGEDDFKMTLAKEVTGKGKANYSSDYLTKIIGVFGDSFYYSVDMAFNTDNPIKLEGKVGDSGTCTYLLAPRIESE